ncbi:tetratricopeptide repeat protein [Streptomyces sp. NPDC092296]|uniref:serine/threonine-protein kinase n=1 Tax=Streptomyces sp. NPDC092296 TaxID=3366012 RepID=UPI00382CE744
MTTPCNRPGCGGRIAATGYCDECGRSPAPPEPPAPAPRPAPPATPPSLRSGPQTPTPSTLAGWSAGGGLPSLPFVGLPDPSALVISDPGPPPGGRRCGKDGCRETVGIGYGGRPAPSRGFCPNCGTPYDFSPQLRPGDRLDDHYEVIGPLAHGGLGWIYLARDIRLEGHFVALKGLINANDAAARRQAEEERRHLVALDHPDVVRIISFATHHSSDPDSRPTDAASTDYIVMEFVGGRSLRQLTDPEEQQRMLGGPLQLEHVVGYGCRILGALEHLHRRGLLYCDMKPDNVIHHGDRVKVIDLGAVRRADDRESPLVSTPYYAPPGDERTAAGWTEASDLHTVGATLRELSNAAARPAGGLSRISFLRVVQRATHPDPRARFGTAAQMARQLWGVLRELRSLDTGQEHPEPSVVFAPTALLLDAGLGAVPPLSRWIDHPDGLPEPDLGRPTAAQVATGLPVPLPDPDDPAAALVTTPTQVGWRRLVEQLAAQRPRTVETALYACRTLLQHDPAAAGSWLTRGVGLLGGEEAAAHDWRIGWHRALLALAGDDVPAAERHLDAVYSALPGEHAPKLALGYCAERRGDAESAARFYEAVWRCDHAQGSAAFGLARIHLGRGEPARAVEVLDGVPQVSRHHDAARIAAVRIHAGRTPGGPPTEDGLREAVRRLPGLYLDEGDRAGRARARLTAEVREAALDWLTGGARAALDGGPLLGAPPTEAGLRDLLEKSLRELAEQARTAADHGVLTDRANAVRPMTFT